MKNKLTNYSYAIFISFFLFVIAFALKSGDKYYILDSILFIIFMTLFYFYFEKMNLDNFTFAFLGIVMAMHGMGRFGFFNYDVYRFWIFPWDTLTHFFASFAITIALFKVLQDSRISYSWKVFIVMMASVGIATVGEFSEFFGAIKSPTGRGLFGIEAGPSPIPWFSEDYWDTMKDLVINAAGSLVGFGWHHIFRKRKV